jgi:hypothetical protein
MLEKLQINMLIFEIVRKYLILAKRRQLAPHMTSGLLWCQKISAKWSPYSTRVARGGKVGMWEERED